jgi:hypothetical protein
VLVFSSVKAKLCWPKTCRLFFTAGVSAFSDYSRFDVADTCSDLLRPASVLADDTKLFVSQNHSIRFPLEAKGWWLAFWLCLMEPSYSFFLTGWRVDHVVMSLRKEKRYTVLRGLEETRRSGCPQKKYLWEITLFDPFELACVRGSFWTWKTRSDWNTGVPNQNVVLFQAAFF